MTIRRPVQFGVGDGYSYSWDRPIIHTTSYRDNFADVQPTTSRIIGASGSINEFGLRDLITANGNVPISWWIDAASQADAEAERDMIMGFVEWGTQPLIFEHDGELRWCWAYINAPDITINSTSAPGNKQRVTCNFRVDDPHWYSINSSLYGGSTQVLFSGTAQSGTGVFGSHQKFRGTVTDGGTAQVVNNGNRSVPAMVMWENAGGTVGGTVNDPQIQWADRSGIVRERLLYDGQVALGDVARIDCRMYRANPGDIDAVDALTGAWMQIPPGTVDLLVSIQSGTAILTVDFQDRWT